MPYTQPCLSAPPCPCLVGWHTTHRQQDDTPLSSSHTGQAQRLRVSALHPSHGRWDPITHPLASSGSRVPGTARAACTPGSVTLSHHPLLHAGRFRGCGILARVMLGGCQGTMVRCRGRSNSPWQHRNHPGSSPGATLALCSSAQGGCD